MRFLDIVFSGIAIALLTPFMLPIVLILWLTGEHQIFYKQKRVGRLGQEFGLLKFATMLKDSPNLPGGLYTSVRDPRMLPMGRFLRKTKINELPQLLNVFFGDMSLVGYRPTVREHFQGYPELARERLRETKPGLTGLGSIVFRNEEEILQQFEDKRDFHQNVIGPFKAALECWYVDHRSLALYFQLLVLTAAAVAFGQKSLWKSWFRGLPEVPEALREYI